MTTRQPKLSVVVASHNARASIRECLSSLLSQPCAQDAELLVVDNSTDGTTEIIRREFPGVRLLVRPPAALIPELWAAGVGESSGEIVAITTAHCVPDRSWLAEILRAHETPAAAVGGAIENDRSAGLVDWAIYFCRYSRFILPFSEGQVQDVAGDNASYKRAAIEQCRHAWRGGFWEPAVHAELRKAGQSLLLLPSIVVFHMKSFGLCSFLKQRFQHGREFGGERASRLSAPRRGLYIALSPSIPALFLARIARQVLARRGHRKEFLLSLPLLVLFLLAWSFGELLGYLGGPARSSDCGLRIADCGLGTKAPDPPGSSLSDKPLSAIRNPQSGGRLRR